jgi:hypothetical protein
MLFAVTHDISDTATFWSRAEASLPNLPAGIKIHSVMPNAVGDKAVCVWEAEDLDAMKAYLEDKTGDVSKNTYLVINERNGMNIPGKAA